jgi:hypothetical protein
MGQPIRLVSPDGEGLTRVSITVYGRHEAAVYLAKGYQPAEDGLLGNVPIPTEDLSLLDGATEAIVQGLTSLGLDTCAAVAAADVDTLTGIKGVGKATAARLRASAEAAANRSSPNGSSR